MNKVSSLGLVFIALVLFSAGCGKKKHHHEAKPKHAVASIQTSIPLLKDDTESLLEDSDIENFAFVDDEAVLQLNDDVSSLLADNSEEMDDLAAATSDIPSTFAFQTINFDLNKNDIRQDQRASLNEDVEVARQAVDQGKQVVIEGHCCQLGSATYNLALSQRRAQVVKAEMVKNGIQAENIKTIGYGYERPLVWSDANDRGQLIQELSPNRRAELLVN